MKFFFFFLAVSAFALEKVGDVVAVEGMMRAQSGRQDERILAAGSEVYLGETLVTDDSGKGQVQFLDGTLLLLIPGSRYVVEAYTKSRFAAKLKEGGARISTGLIAKKKPENFEVNTPNATIGVRGTILEARMLEGNLYVGASSGAVNVKNRGGKVDLGTDEFASVPSMGDAPEMLGGRPSALSLSNFTPPSGGIPFGGATSSMGAGAVAGTDVAAGPFGWAPAVGGLVVIGAVVGVTVGAATSSNPTFSHSFSH